MKLQAEHIERNLQDRTSLGVGRNRTKHTYIRVHAHLGPVVCQAEGFHITKLRKKNYI